MLGFSIVTGILKGFPDAIAAIVFLAIFPDRVFGKPGTMTTVLKAATGPTCSRTAFTTLSLIFSGLSV